jgi:hypothetical protein
MMTADDILKTEYSEIFDIIRKARMATSFYKYGPLKLNYPTRCCDAVKTLEKYLQKYKDTGNTEFLADVANFAMIEFMYPQHPNSHFRATDSNESPGVVGAPINQEADHDKL